MSGWVQRQGLPAESHMVEGRRELSGLLLEHKSKGLTSHHFGGHVLNMGILGGHSNLHLSYLFIIFKSILTPHTPPQCWCSFCPTSFPRSFSSLLCPILCPGTVSASPKLSCPQVPCWISPMRNTGKSEARKRESGFIFYSCWNKWPHT